MKAKLILAALVVLIITTGFECINDPIIVSLNADKFTGCYAVNTGNGQFSGTTTQNIAGLIPSDYQNKLKGVRLYDVVVRATGNYPTGAVSGDAYARFGSGTEYHLLRFSGQYSQFAAGVSLLNSGGLIIPDRAGLLAITAILSNANPLPAQVTLRAVGGGPAVNQTFSVCFDVYMQVDAEAN